MNYAERQKVESDIASDIEDINKHEDVDNYISAHFSQFLTAGEYNDNSMELAYHFEMLKEIQNDPRFVSKLRFVLSKYVTRRMPVK